MSDDTDFVSMYEELGLNAECGMAAFKQAYRRRVALLHPDTQGQAADLPRLQRLNRLYESAMEFHRVHGRLPGAPTTPQRPQAPRLERIAPAMPVEDDGFEPPRSRRRYLLLGALLAALLYWLGANRTSIPTLDPGAPGDSASAAWQPRSPKQLELGMDLDQARRILGEPTTEHAARWQYGPSWVDFECGKVTGWYSAPAQPLEVGRDSAHQASEGPHGAATCG
ncbi:hypothetical protein LJR125_001522 [Pseudoxanthomonas sp. LjRoot125]|uniref:hypothetical protein n=1 Tax=Pseudoxanthomonas sp. LjRoot125 TaxID=3342258 RepID=UPI003E121725